MTDRILLLIKKKQVSRIIIWQHEDCAIYCDALGIISPKKMYRKQISDMKTIDTAIGEENPDTERRLLYGMPKNIKRKKFEFHIIK